MKPNVKIGNLVLDKPIIQGGMGIGVSRSRLAGAVAKEGGMGVISTAQIGYDSPLLCHSKNKPPALQVEGISSDKSNSCAKLDVGLQTTNKKHRRSKMDNNSLAHTKWDCKYHLVFAPKYRRQVIYKDIKADVGQILGTLCRRKGIEIIEAQCMPDHIHMLVSIPPKYSVSEVVGYLKGKSSLMIFEKHANLKYKYGNRHFWCRGYYVDTVGKNTSAIKAYIQNQIKEDLEYDQMSLVEYIDPFTGEPVKKNKK